MPKELTHWILAERALADLDADNRLHGIIRAHRGLYLAGAVLPDTLLHLVRGPYSPTALALAHRFHDNFDNSCMPLIRAEESCGGALPSPLLSCLLGVLSHMQADIVFHPFVHALGGSNDIGLHYHLETALDLHFIHHGAVSPVQRLDDLVTSGIRDELITACALLFDPDGKLPRQVLEKALKLHCRIQAMYDSTMWQLASRILACLPVPLFRRSRYLFYPLVLPKHDEFEMNGTWRHPDSGEERNESVEDLAEEALRQTVNLFLRIGEQNSLKSALTFLPEENP